MATENNNPHSEGPVATAIEEQTAKIPSDVFLWAALASMAASLTLKITGQKHTALFVGQWGSTIFIAGYLQQAGKIGRPR